tara:strand:+ start:172 stop:363 length:192 start_codon:yes stop_codon:yes gene_type:complete
MMMMTLTTLNPHHTRTTRTGTNWNDPYESITGDDDIEFFDSEGGLTAEALAFLADEDNNGRFI